MSARLQFKVAHYPDLNGLGDGKDDAYHPWGGGNLRWWNNNKKHAWPLDDLKYFHNNGKIVNWSDQFQILNGAFVGTDDLKTSDPFVQNHLIEAFKNLIDATDCDGFRVDAIKHVEKPFLMHWADTMRKHAGSIGKNNFILFGENFTYDDHSVAEHCKDPGYAFNSALYFPMQLTIKEVFAYEHATRKLQDRLNNLHLYGEGAQNLVTFMDNHDVDRIALEAGSEWQNKLRPALTFLYTGTPVPCLFYGTEHGFNQGGTRNRGLEDGDYQREVMFNYGYQPGNAWGDKFHTSPTYDYIKKLNELRRDYPALTRGNMVNRWQDTGGRGLFAYTRTLGDQEALVVFNTDWSNKTLSPQVGKPDGTVFVNLLDPTETKTVSGGRLNDITVGSKGSKIFFAGTSKSDVQTVCTRTSITINYKPNKGPLENPVGNIILSIRDDANVNANDYAMTLAGGTYSYTHNLSNTTNSITFWFRDQSNPPIYDNNDNQNWTVVTKDCWKTGIDLAFVGNISTWPPAGELDAGEDLWIDIQTWPKRAAFDGMVVFSADGGATWYASDILPNGEVGNNDAWHVNLGPFARGTTIRFAVMMEGENGEIWNNNSGADYFITVNSDVVPVAFVGNTYHWPHNGDLDPSDDLWINVESGPIGAGVMAAVIFTVDGGANWQSRALNQNGVTDVHDMWHVNLGKFPGNTIIQYAVMVADDDAIQNWDNNNGADFIASVNSSGSSIHWYGNVKHFSAERPEVGVRYISGAPQLEMQSLKNGSGYSVFWSTNLMTWNYLKSIQAVYPGQYENLSEDDEIRFYLMRLDNGLADLVRDDQTMVVTIETTPPGGATEANIVFSADGGSNWSAMPMVFTGEKDGKDIWTANLGEFATGTQIKYAIEVKDDTSTSLWDNNGTQDYSVVVVP